MNNNKDNLSANGNILSKRELAAILILQGFLSSQPALSNPPPGEKIKMVKRAIEYSDSLLKELENTENKK